MVMVKIVRQVIYRLFNITWRIIVFRLIIIIVNMLNNEKCKTIQRFRLLLYDRNFKLKIKRNECRIISFVYN